MISTVYNWPQQQDILLEISFLNPSIAVFFVLLFFFVLNMISYSSVVDYECNIFIWNWSKTTNVNSALWMLMSWRFSTRASEGTMLGMHQCVSGCLRVNTEMMQVFNTLRPRQNGRHFADNMFKCIFLNENVWIPIEISLTFVPIGSINNNPVLFQIMAWSRPGDKPLSEAMMVSSRTHICITRPQWVKIPLKEYKDQFILQSITCQLMTWGHDSQGERASAPMVLA